MRITWRDLEKGFAVFTMLLLSDALSLRSVFVPPEGSVALTSNSPIDSAIAMSQYLVLLITLIFLGLFWQKTIFATLRNFLIPLFAVFCVCSIYWSDFPSITTRGSLLFFSTTAFGLYLAIRYTIKEQMQLVAIAMGIAGFVSLILGVVMPSAAIEQNSLRQGAWRGVFYHKNNLGMFMYLGAIAALLTAQSAKHPFTRLWGWFAFTVTFLLVVLSESKTSLLVFFILLLLIPYCRVLRWHSRYLVPCLTLFILVVGSLAVWLIGNYEFLLLSLGKDPTFSGRTDIWGAVINSALERPWAGYGYDAFWVEDSGRCLGECAYVRSAINFKATSSHNGYIDLAAAMGFGGLGLFLAGLLFAYQRSITRIVQGYGKSSFWPFLFLVSLVLYTQSESAVFAARSLPWAIYVGAALAPIPRWASSGHDDS